MEVKNNPHLKKTLILRGAKKNPNLKKKKLILRGGGGRFLRGFFFEVVSGFFLASSWHKSNIFTKMSISEFAKMTIFRPMKWKVKHEYYVYHLPIVFFW